MGSFILSEALYKNRPFTIYNSNKIQQRPNVSFRDHFLSVRLRSADVFRASCRWVETRRTPGLSRAAPLWRLCGKIHRLAKRRWVCGGCFSCVRFAVLISWRGFLCVFVKPEKKEQTKGSNTSSWRRRAANTCVPPRADGRYMWASLWIFPKHLRLFPEAVWLIALDTSSFVNIPSFSFDDFSSSGLTSHSDLSKHFLVLERPILLQRPTKLCQQQHSDQSLTHFYSYLSWFSSSFLLFWSKLNILTVWRAGIDFFL